MKIAVSTMTNCLSFLEQGTEAAMRELASCAAQYIEISQHIPTEDADLAELERCCEETGIRVCAISCRFSPAGLPALPELMWQGKPLRTRSLQEDADSLAALCRRFHCRYLRFGGFPGHALRTPEQTKCYMAELEACAAALQEQGIGLCVHNHADEFMKVEGRWLLSWAMELAPHLLLELDVKNALVCGVDPVSLLERYPGRVPLLHVQDLEVCPGDDWTNPIYRGVPAGEGNIDWARVCAAARKSGTVFSIIEQADTQGRETAACIRTAMATLSSL